MPPARSTMSLTTWNRQRRSLVSANLQQKVRPQYVLMACHFVCLRSILTAGMPPIEVRRRMEHRILEDL